MRNSDHDRDIWRRLVFKYGGSRQVARRIGVSQRTVSMWKSGARVPPEWRIDQLLALVDDHLEQDEIRAHLLTWKRAAGEKRVVKTQKARKRFFDRMGHMPEDRRGGVMVIEPHEERDPMTGEVIRVPGTLIPTRPSSYPGWNREGGF
jgi:hypothetical protein